MAKFELLTQNEYDELTELFVSAARENLMKEKLNTTGDAKYEVVLQNDVTTVVMSDAEVEESAKAALDILEELKQINEYFDRKSLIEAERQAKKGQSDKEIVVPFYVFNSFATEKLNEIIGKVAKMRRVGGAYAMLIAIPFLKSAIYSAFDRIIDDFDNEDLYIHSGYFVFRAIMQMNPS